MTRWRLTGRPGSPLRYSARPRLRRPVVLMSFRGWNDAGDAASEATAHLATVWGAAPFAEIDPEEFTDFTASRPEVRVVDGSESREITWPSTILMSASPPGNDVVIVRGHEPQLRWRTYAELLVGALAKMRPRIVVTFGALLAEVAHTRPVPVTATAADPRLLEDHGMGRARYEGPTGIVGVLHSALAEAGVPSASLWASVPFYVAQTPSAKAALALVAKAERMLEIKIDTEDLEVRAAAYEQEIGELVTEDAETAAYVARLEEMGTDPEDGTTRELAAEIERFLRDHRSR
jgi:predicted ATP-grasp superfamily ATP-dependent carboligase